MPSAPSWRRRSAPWICLRAPVRERVRPAPWQVEPKERSSDPGSPASTKLEVPKLAVGGGDLVRASGEGPGGALAVDEQLATVVALDLGDVVCDVVHLSRPFRRRLPEDGRNRGACLVSDRLPVRPSEVGGGRHRREVGATLG